MTTMSPIKMCVSSTQTGPGQRHPQNAVNLRLLRVAGLRKWCKPSPRLIEHSRPQSDQWLWTNLAVSVWPPPILRTFPRLHQSPVDNRRHRLAPFSWLAHRGPRRVARVAGPDGVTAVPVDPVPRSVDRVREIIVVAALDRSRTIAVARDRTAALTQGPVRVRIAWIDVVVETTGLGEIVAAAMEHTINPVLITITGITISVAATTSTIVEAERVDSAEDIIATTTTRTASTIVALTIADITTTTSIIIITEEVAG